MREAIEAGGLRALFTADDLDPAVRSRQLGIETLHADEVIRRLTSTVSPPGRRRRGRPPRRRARGRAGRDGRRRAWCVHRAAPRGARPGQRGDRGALGRCGGGERRGVRRRRSTYNPKTVRATAGSIFPLPIVRGVDTLSAIESVRDRGARVLAMAAEEHPTSTAPICPGGSRSCSATRRTACRRRSSRRPTLPSGCPSPEGRVSQPRRGGDGLPVRVAAPAPAIRRRRSTASSRLRRRHPITLTAMKGFGYALETRWDAMTEEQRTLMLHGIVHADHMDTILRQLVDAARVVGGSLETFREQVVVSELVGTVVDSLGRDGSSIAQWLGDDATVFVDPARLRTALLAFWSRSCGGARRVPSAWQHRSMTEPCASRPRGWPVSRPTRWRCCSCLAEQGRAPAARSVSSWHAASPRRRAGAAGRIWSTGDSPSTSAARRTRVGPRRHPSAPVDSGP